MEKMEYWRKNPLSVVGRTEALAMIGVESKQYGYQDSKYNKAPVVHADILSRHAPSQAKGSYVQM
jgi:hypothetical protein